MLTIWRDEDYYESDSPSITLKGKYIHRRLRVAIPRVAGRLDISKVVVAVSDITERKQAEETLRRQREYLAALHDTTLGLISRLELNDLLEALISRAGQLLGASHGFIYLVEFDAILPTQEGAVLERKVGVGIFSQLIGFRLKPGEGLAGKVWQTGQPLVVDDYDTWPDRCQILTTSLSGR